MKGPRCAERQGTYIKETAEKKEKKRRLLRLMNNAKKRLFS